MDLHSNFSISLKIVVFLSKEKNKDQGLSYFNILTNRDALYNLTENCLQFFCRIYQSIILMISKFYISIRITVDR